jgi:hypothetical protein
MPVKREARELSEFFKFKQPGQIVVGVADKFGVTGQFQTQYVVFEPALLRGDANGTPTKYGSLAVGLSADLLAKISPRNDVGRYLSVQFTGHEPSKKGAPKKVFEVLELTKEEFEKMEKRASGDYSRAYRSESNGDSTGDDDDDLPF